MVERVDRRGFLARALPLTGAVLAARTAIAPADTSSGESGRRPLALVYRGPAACQGCAESVAALLRGSPAHFRTAFCGPAERVPLSAPALASATLYAQPGGGDLAPAWREMRRYAGDIRAFVSRGGHYLGFCLGGYLAGRTPGFGLLPGDADEYVTSPGAGVHTTNDTVIAVRWRGHVRHMFFQDGPYFSLDAGAPAIVLARYLNGLPAAVVARYGEGSVGVVGPHPEADQSWFADDGFSTTHDLQFDLGYDLIETTLEH